MTFAEFQATKRYVESIGAVLRDEVDRWPGFLYCDDCLYIVDTKLWPEDAPGYGEGQWYTIIGRGEYQSDDLEAIERHLYEFAVSEGYGAH